MGLKVFNLKLNRGERLEQYHESYEEQLILILLMFLSLSLSLLFW